MKKPMLPDVIADLGRWAETFRQLAAQEFDAHRLAIEYRYEKAADHLEGARLHLSHILSHLPDPPGR